MLCAACVEECACEGFGNVVGGYSGGRRHACSRPFHGSLLLYLIHRAFSFFADTCLISFLSRSSSSGCTFCATGQMGQVRSLSTDEILVQMFFARQICRTHRLPPVQNVVFMGMGTYDV